MRLLTTLSIIGKEIDVGINDEILTAVIDLKGEVGEVKQAIKSHTEEYVRGKKANISDHDYINAHLKRINGDMAYKMDKRKNNGLIKIQAVIDNWKIILLIGILLSASGGGVALKWSKILKFLGL